MSNNTNETYSESQYLRGMVWTSGGNIIAILASMLTIVVASRLLSQEELGAYFLILMLGNFVNVLGGFGLQITGIKFISSAPLKERSYVGNVLLSIRFVQITLVCIAMVCIIPILTRVWDSEVFASVVWFIIPFIALQMLQTAMSIIFVGYHKFAVFSAISASNGVANAILGVTLLFLGFGIKGLVWGLIGSSFLCCVIAWRMLPFKLSLTYGSSKMWEVLKFGGWMYGSSVFSIATVRAAEAILATYAGPALVAIYGTAERIPALLLRLFEAIRPVVLSYVSSQQTDVRRATVISVRILLGVLSACSAVIMVFSKQIVLVLFSEKYLQSVPILRMLSFWFSISIISYLLALSLVGMNRAKQVFFGSMMQFLVMVIFNILLVPRYGAMGAAVSLTIVAVIYNIVAIFMIAGREIKMVLSLVTAMCRSAIPLFGLFLVLQLMDPPVLIAAVLLALFGVVLFLLKAITPRDVKILWTRTFCEKMVHTR